MNQQEFKQRHVDSVSDFTRKRKLTFPRVVVLTLQKTVKSIQTHLNEFFGKLSGDNPGIPVTDSAWCQARVKYRHTLFVELNERTVLENIYEQSGDFEVRRWEGFRLVGIDGSLVRLPNCRELGEHFGWVECSNKSGANGRYPQGRLSVMYDLLNDLALHSQMVPWKNGERGLAKEHINRLEDNDLAVLDRGYGSYEMFAYFAKLERHFLCRCAKGTFKAVNELFAQNKGNQSVICQLRPPKRTRKALAQAGLPTTMTVRFVSLFLKTGELEVLATTLLDQQRYSPKKLGELYGLRWGIETFYGVIKGRLELGNFSGRTVEAILQDTFATIYVSNLETVLTRPIREEMAERSQELKNPIELNQAISFHTIKTQAIDLLLGDKPPEEILPKLEALFRAKPVSSRPNRAPPRRKPSGNRSYNYQRNAKKAVF